MYEDIHQIFRYFPQWGPREVKQMTIRERSYWAQYTAAIMDRLVKQQNEPNG